MKTLVRMVVISFCLALLPGLCAGEVVYKTDFTHHYFDSGTFGVGALTGDGWEAPQNNPVQIIKWGNNQRLYGAGGYQWSLLDLTSKSAGVTGDKTVLITFVKRYINTTATEPFTATVYSGGTDRKEIGATETEIGSVVFTKGTYNKGIIALVGDRTVFAAHNRWAVIETEYQKIEWKIDLKSRLMSLVVYESPYSMDNPVAVARLKDASIGSIDGLGFGFGNDARGQFADLKIEVIGPGGMLDAAGEDAALKRGSLSAEIDNGRAKILKDGQVILSDDVGNLAKSAPLYTDISGRNIRGIELKWEDGGTVFTKRVVVKDKEALLEYLLDTDQNLDWRIGLQLPEAAWGDKFRSAFEGPEHSFFLGNGMEMQLGEAFKRGTVQVWWRDPYWRREFKYSTDRPMPIAVDGAYPFAQSSNSVPDPRRLRSVVRVLLDGPGYARDLNGDLVDRGNTIGNLNQIAEDHFTILPCRDRKWLTTGERVKIDLKYVADDDIPRKFPVEWSLVDCWGKQFDHGVFTLDSTKSSDHTLAFAPHRNGTYRLEFRYLYDKTPRMNEAIFAVLPKLGKVKLPDAGSILGGHHFSGKYTHWDQPSPWMQNLWRSAGMKWNRWWDVPGDLHWENLEPEEGKWEFKVTDALLENDQKNGAITLAVLALSQDYPGWVSSRIPDLGSNPEEYGKFWAENYVRPVAEHLKGKIHYWEVGNENFCFIPAKNYTSILKHAYRVLKEVNPANQVIGICGFPNYPRDTEGLSYFKEIFDTGGYDCLDIVSAHYYVPISDSRDPNGDRRRLYTGSMPGDELRMRGWIDATKELMRRYGKEKPLWDSENFFGGEWGSMFTLPSTRQNFIYTASWPGSVLTGPDTPISKAGYAVKMLTVHLAENVKFFYHTFYASHDKSSFTEVDNTPMTWTVAWTQFARTMEGAKYVETLNLSKDVQAYLFDRAGIPIVLLWGTYFDEGDRTQLRTELKPGLLRVQDMFGNELKPGGSSTGLYVQVTGNPVYLIGKGITGKEMKTRLLRGKQALHQ